jgi:coenzyme F420-reducing hydrogenase delta subunit
MENMSAAMAGQFVSVAKEMTERMAELGSNPLKGNESTSNLSKASDV